MDVRGKRIVLIGDSHTDAGGFGAVVKARLESLGASVTVLGIGGSSAASWLSGKPVCRTYGSSRKCHSLSEAEGNGFDLAIVALGTNDAGAANGAGGGSARYAKVIRQIAELGQRVAPTVVWVGPPKMQDTVKWFTNAAMDALYAEGLPVFGSNAIDSRRLMPAVLGGDGVHLSPAGYGVWGDGIVTALLAKGDIPTSSGVRQQPPASSGMPVGLILATAAVVILVWRRNA